MRHFSNGSGVLSEAQRAEDFDILSYWSKKTDRK